MRNFWALNFFILVNLVLISPSRADEVSKNDSVSARVFGRLFSAGKTKEGSDVLAAPKEFSVPLSKTVDGVSFSRPFATPNVLAVRSFITFGQPPSRSRSDIAEILADVGSVCAEAQGKLVYSASSPRSRNDLTRQLINMLKNERLFGLHSCVLDKGEAIFSLWVEPSVEAVGSFLPLGSNWDMLFALVDQSGWSTFNAMAKEYSTNVLTTRSEFSSTAEQFRNSVKVGSAAAVKSENGRYECALVVDVKEPIVQVQFAGKVTYMEKSNLFPSSYEAAAPRNSLNYNCVR